MTGLEDITAVKDLDKAMEDAGQEAKEMAQAIQNLYVCHRYYNW